MDQGEYPHPLLMSGIFTLTQSQKHNSTPPRRWKASKTTYGKQTADDPAGISLRRRSLLLLKRVIDDQQPLDYLIEREALNDLDPQDRHFVRALTAITLRHRFQIDAILANVMKKPLGKRAGTGVHILYLGIAQLLFMDIADHAAVSTAVDLAKHDSRAKHFARLINGVLRTIARDKTAIQSSLDPLSLVPCWLRQQWIDAYGVDQSTKIVQQLSMPPYLDLTVKADPEKWAELLGGISLPNKTLRLKQGGDITKLPGFEEGAWWVQDVSAHLAASLLGDVDGKQVADLCAAPGGKTACLANRGARVCAVDYAASRLQKLEENLRRLDLEAEIVESDVITWQPRRLFDAVLLDAPCSATGIIRKHPDILSLKSKTHIETMASRQYALLQKAAHLLKPQGRLVFCTCSLQPEEGEQLVDLISRQRILTLDPLTPEEVPGFEECLKAPGWLRILPFYLTHEDPLLNGMDGFFAARFVALNKVQ